MEFFIDRPVAKAESTLCHITGFKSCYYRPGGNRGLPDHPGVFPNADAALVVGPHDAQLLQAAWWEPTRIRYGLGHGYMKVDPAEMKPDSGAWVHPVQIVSRGYVVPATGALVAVRPAIELRQGQWESDQVVALELLRHVPAQAFPCTSRCRCIT